VSENAKSRIEFTIYGEPASKANSRVWTGRRLIKSKKALSYAKTFESQCSPLETLLKGILRATITIYYASRRPDLDPSLILDLMQGRIYENDRQVREMHLYWGLDKTNPRAEIAIEVIGDSNDY